MNRFGITLICVAIAALIIGATFLPAQQTRVSPHETISAVIDGNRVTIVYGRPYTKDPKSDSMRKIWGTLVPYDKVWRTGANAVTRITFDGDVTVEGQKLAAGSRDAEAVATLARAARRDDYALVREAAARALHAVDPDAARPVLHELAERDAEPRVRKTARELLGSK